MPERNPIGAASTDGVHVLGYINKEVYSKNNKYFNFFECQVFQYLPRNIKRND